MSARLLGLFCSLVFCAVPGLLFAQAVSQPTPQAAPEAASTAISAEADAEARSLYEAGRVAYNAGRFEAALDYFQRAFALSSRPALQLNIGRAADQAGRLELALSAFERFLADVPTSPDRRGIELRVTAIRGQLAAREESQTTAQQPGSGDGSASEGGTEIWQEWWFWTIAGVVVVGGGVGVAAAISANDTAPFAMGNTGGVVFTLELP